MRESSGEQGLRMCWCAMSVQKSTVANVCWGFMLGIVTSRKFSFSRTICTTGSAKSAKL